MSVVSKSRVDAPFGNDADVVSKTAPCAAFGNDTAMFVRVRHRTLNGHHMRNGQWITKSTSFDVVRAVRINGKPRQKFLFGLGSLKEPVSQLHWFWWHAMCRLNRNISDKRQRQRIIDAMVRKGAPPFSRDQVDYFVKGWPFMAAH